MRFNTPLRRAALVALAALSAASARGHDADAVRPERTPSLLVIAPNALADAVRPLVEHKNRTGLPARLVTIESLAKDSGKDDAERVKRAIFSAHADGARFVLLVGDASLFPVRYRQVRQLSTDAHVDCTYNPSDLYYSDLFHDHAPGADATDPSAITHGAAFDDWDADGDDAFDAQHWAADAARWNPDRVDGCPDVAVGRLPAHTPFEVSRYVEKAIRFETSADPDASQRIACVADACYCGSTTMCDDLLARGLSRGFADDVSVERLLIGSDESCVPPPRWRRASFADVDAALDRDGWLVYLGHGSARRWEAKDEDGRRCDSKHVPRRRDGVAPAIVLSVSCESGRFMAWAPSEQYRDAKGVKHAFVYDADAKRWTDEMVDRVVGPRLVVPPPSEYDLPENRDRCFASAWLFAPGGAVLFAGESLVCENDKGRDLVALVLASHVGEHRVFGDVWLEGQRRYWLANRGTDDVFRNPRVYLGIMTLFGDPSLRLPKPL